MSGASDLFGQEIKCGDDVNQFIDKVNNWVSINSAVLTLVPQTRFMTAVLNMCTAISLERTYKANDPAYQLINRLRRIAQLAAPPLAAKSKKSKRIGGKDEDEDDGANVEELNAVALALALAAESVRAQLALQLYLVLNEILKDTAAPPSLAIVQAIDNAVHAVNSAALGQPKGQPGVYYLGDKLAEIEGLLQAAATAAKDRNAVFAESRLVAAETVAANKKVLDECFGTKKLTPQAWIDVIGKLPKHHEMDLWFLLPVVEILKAYTGEPKNDTQDVIIEFLKPIIQIVLTQNTDRLENETHAQLQAALFVAFTDILRFRGAKMKLPPRVILVLQLVIMAGLDNSEGYMFGDSKNLETLRALLRAVAPTQDSHAATLGTLKTLLASSPSESEVFVAPHVTEPVSTKPAAPKAAVLVTATIPADPVGPVVEPVSKMVPAVVPASQSAIPVTLTLDPSQPSPAGGFQSALPPAPAGPPLPHRGYLNKRRADKIVVAVVAGINKDVVEELWATAQKIPVGDTFYSSYGFKSSTENVTSYVIRAPMPTSNGIQPSPCLMSLEIPAGEKKPIVLRLPPLDVMTKEERSSDALGKDSPRIQVAAKTIVEGALAWGKERGMKEGEIPLTLKLNSAPLRDAVCEMVAKEYGNKFHLNSGLIPFQTCSPIKFGS